MTERSLVDDPLGWSSGWRTSRQPTLGEFSEHVAGLLRSIRSLHPDMEALSLLGRNSPHERTSPWQGDRAVTDWVMQHAWEPKPPTTCRYDHLDTRGRPTAASRGRMGFTLYLDNGRRESDQRLRISIHDTGLGGGGVGMLVPAAHVDDYAAEGWFESLWQAVSREWPVQDAAVDTRAWADAVSMSERGWVTRQVGGCTFSSDPSLVEAVPPGVPWHPLPGGGIAVCITRRPDRLLAADVARAIDFRDRLQRAGMARLWRLD